MFQQHPMYARDYLAERNWLQDIIGNTWVRIIWNCYCFWARYNHDLWDAGLIKEILCEAPANEADNDIQIDDDEMD